MMLAIIFSPTVYQRHLKKKLEFKSNTNKLKDYTLLQKLLVQKKAFYFEFLESRLI